MHPVAAGEAVSTTGPARDSPGLGERDSRCAIRVVGDLRPVCSKRLQPLIPVLLPALEQQGKLALDDRQRERLSISAATIDRLLSEVRLAAAGGRRRRAGLSLASGMAGRIQLRAAMIDAKIAGLPVSGAASPLLRVTGAVTVWSDRLS